MPQLQRLTKVCLRKIWSHEASDFTPWLADEGNISLISDTIGIELEVEAQEKSVGPFRADILCKETITGNWVLIENQLEPTDHTHLGQLLTYAAGLNAVTIVWIAERFTNEHRAALDWLNEITDEAVNFFGLEIELWRIGDSPIAPKFNIVSQPNGWTKSVSASARTLNPDNLTKTQRLQLEYWTVLREVLQQRNGVVNPVKPQPQSWLNFAIGRSSFLLCASINTVAKWIYVGLTLHGSNAKPHFHLLKQEQATIENEIKTKLSWEELSGKKSSWSVQHQWLAKNLEAFHNVFSPRIKNIDASDYSFENA